MKHFTAVAALAAILVCGGATPARAQPAPAIRLYTLDCGLFAAFLFDMDGTILTSIKAAERVWGRWAQGHGLDVAAFLPSIHGKRTEETVRGVNLPGVDPVAEAAWITAGIRFYLGRGGSGLRRRIAWCSRTRWRDWRRRRLRGWRAWW